MIKTTYIKNNKIQHTSLPLKGIKGEKWIDCLNPSRKELAEISKATKIPIEDLERGLDEDERPKIIDFNKYSVITVSVPFKNKKKNHTITPMTMFITDHIFLILRKNEIEAINKIYDYPDEKKISILIKDVTYTLYTYMSEVMDNYFKAIDEIEEQINILEESIFKNPEKKTVKDIFHTKKSLIYFHKALVGNREVITGIEKKFLKHVKGKNLKSFRYLYNDVTQLIDMVGTYRDILTGTLDIYLSSVSNNLNAVMKKLTIITSFAMVPTLIASIYGMNFNTKISPYNMPELNWAFGYPLAFLLMIISVAIVYFYFKKKEWI